jgi:hypothetical protein
MPTRAENKRTFTLTIRTAVLMAVALVLAGSIPAAIATIVLGPKLVEVGEEADIAVRVSETIIDAEVEECRSDKLYRSQYRARGEAVEFLLGFVKKVSHANDGLGIGITEQEVDHLINPFLRRIEIFPTQNCQELADELREHLP